MAELSQRPGVFLEVGVGANDFIAMPTPLVGVDRQVTPLDFRGANQYIGIDMPLQANRYWRNLHQWFVGGDVYMDENSRQETPDIVNGLIDVRKVVRSYRPNDQFDFMVADGQQLPFRDGQVAEVYMSNVVGSQMDEGSLKTLFKEARRVIGSAGRLTIRENITPQWVPDELDDMLDGAGFNPTVAEKHLRTSSEYDDLVKMYGTSWQDQPSKDDILGLRNDHMFMRIEV